MKQFPGEIRRIAFTGAQAGVPPGNGGARRSPSPFSGATAGVTIGFDLAV